MIVDEKRIQVILIPQKDFQKLTMVICSHITLDIIKKDLF